MKSNLLILNSLFPLFPFCKEITINISPSIPKHRLGSTILEFPATRRVKDLEASLRKNGRVTEIVWRNAFKETGQKAELECHTFRKGRTLWVAAERRPGQFQCSIFQLSTKKGKNIGMGSLTVWGEVSHSVYSRCYLVGMLETTFLESITGTDWCF